MDSSSPDPSSPSSHRPPEVQLPLKGKAEDRFATACARIFNTPDGVVVLQGLRSMTVNAILPDSASANQLFYREGARSLVAFIETAKLKGETGDVDNPPARRGQRNRRPGNEPE